MSAEVTAHCFRFSKPINCQINRCATFLTVSIEIKVSERNEGGGRRHIRPAEGGKGKTYMLRFWKSGHLRGDNDLSNSQIHV